MATLLWKGNEFRISHQVGRSQTANARRKPEIDIRCLLVCVQEMIKGMRVGGVGSALSYLDTLVIPIIENTPDEEDLREGMEEVSFTSQEGDARAWACPD